METLLLKDTWVILWHILLGAGVDSFCRNRSSILAMHFYMFNLYFHVVFNYIFSIEIDPAFYNLFELDGVNT